MFEFLFNGAGNSVNVNELDGLLGKINLIDIREPDEYKAGHVPTARNIPMNTILSNADKYLDKSKEYYIICHSGSRSSRTCSVLKANGFNVIDVSGGTGRYRGNLDK
jgi:rhodanese-related sulfurtransferase